MDELKHMLYEHHRKAGFICCPETCFCWDVESLIALREQQSGLTPRAADGDTVCPHCHHEYGVHEMSCPIGG